VADAKKPEDKTDWSLAKRLFDYVRADKKWLIVVLILTPLGVLADVLQPVLLKIGIDEHITPRDLSGLGMVAVAYAGTVLFAWLSASLGYHALQKVSLRALARLRSAIFNHVMAQGSRFFDKRHAGSLMTRTINDVDAVYESLARGAIQLLTNSLAIVGMLVSMLILDPGLTLVAFLFSPIIYFVVGWFRRRLRPISLQIRESLSALNGFFAERVFGMTVLQLYGAEKVSADKFDEMSKEYMVAYHRSNWLDAGLYAVMDGMSALATGGRRLLGRDPVRRRPRALGHLDRRVGRVHRLPRPHLRAHPRALRTDRDAAAQLRRAREDLRAARHEREVPPRHAQAAGPREGRRVVRGGALPLRARAPRRAQGHRSEARRGRGRGRRRRDRLGQVHARQAPDPHVLGLRGAHCDRRRRARRAPGDRRARRGDRRAPRRVWLMEGTIADNIRLGDMSITDADIIEAVRLSRAAMFVDELPLGIQAHVAERGRNLSSGERQLLSIARAMARKAPIVILDEATASVDSMTERQIDAALETLFETHTVLVIAHRLQTIQKADRIVVLHQGEVVETGNHLELMALGGRYKLLVETGFAL
jgi:ATP-binding cassette subfamily B multidrug efflux pump